MSLLYMYFFNILIIWLQGVHNFISVACVILFCLPFFLTFYGLNVSGIVYVLHYVCILACEGWDLKTEMQL
jgi:hypothetical protein